MIHDPKPATPDTQQSLGMKTNYGGFGTIAPPLHPCPTCGRCPSCGRGPGWGVWPYWQPYWIWNTTGTISNTQGG